MKQKNRRNTQTKIVELHVRKKIQWVQKKNFNWLCETTFEDIHKVKSLTLKEGEMRVMNCHESKICEAARLKGTHI